MNKTESGHGVVGKCVCCNKTLTEIHRGVSSITFLINLCTPCFRKQFKTIDDDFHGQNKIISHSKSLDAFDSFLLDLFVNPKLKDIDTNLFQFLDTIIFKNRSGDFSIWKHASYNKKNKAVSGYYQGVFKSYDNFLQDNYTRKLKR